MKVTKLLDGTPINKKQFMKWIEALRSGEYKQTTGGMYRDGGFCCLGVCSRILGVTNSEMKNEWWPTNRKDPQWLQGINEDFLKRKAVANGRTSHMDLSQLNDHLKASFDEIADTLEAVYVLGVLG